MARRYFNWKLAIVLIVGVMVLGVAAYAVHQWQKETRAERGLELGNQAYEEKNYEEAAAQLGRYVGVYKDNIPAMLKYADAHLHIRPLKRNNIQHAIGAYNIILRQDPANAEAAERLVGIHVDMHAFGEAERIAMEFLDKTENLEVRKMYATALARQRKFPEAIAEFRDIIADEPNQIRVYGYLGQMVIKKVAPAEFEENETPAYWYDQAVKKNPDSAMAYVLRSAFHRSNAQEEKALAQLEIAEKLELTDDNVRIMLAGEYLNAILVNKAEKHLEAAKEEEDRNNAILLEKAEKHLEAVKEKDPQNAALWNMWARLAMESNSKQKAIKVAEEGLESLAVMPWDFMPRAAELFIMAEESQRAAECIEKLNRKDINPWMVAGLRAMMAELKGDRRAAAKYWQQSVSLGGSINPQAQLNLAAALLAIGDTQSAMRRLTTFLSQNPNLPAKYLFEGHLSLAKVLVRTGDWPGVAEHTRRALQIAPKLGLSNSEAALLNLQARVQLLAAADPAADTRAWDDVTARLASHEIDEGSDMQTKLLKLQIMIQREQFTEAAELVVEIKEEYSSQYKVAMAEVGLLVARDAQDGEDRAIQMLNQVANDFPELAEPVKFLALMLDRQGNSQKGEAVIKQALERMKEPVPRLELGLLLTQLYEKWGRPDDSYALLQELSKEDPNSIPVKRRLLVSKPVAEDLEMAQKIVDELKAIEGEDGWQWRFEQARIWFNGDEFSSRSSDIISLLKKNLLANPDDQPSRVMLAQTYQRTGRSETALSTFREALGRSPDNVQLIVLTVAALFNAKEYDEATEILNRISKEELTDPQLKRLQFQNLIRRGELGSVADMLNEYLVADPNNVSLGLSLALLKMQQNEFDDARKLLKELHAKDPKAVPTLVAQVKLHVLEGKADEALKLCDQIVEDNKNAQAYIIRASTYISLEQLDKAGEDYDRAVEADPKNPNVLAARSNFYSMTGEKAKAMADIEKALELAPDDSGIQRRAVDIFLEARTRDNTAKAQAIIDRALKDNPDDSQLRLRKAVTLLAEATAPAIEKAVRKLEKLTEDDPGFVDAWRLLAKVLMRQGLSARALDAILQGLVHNERDKKLLVLKARAEASKSPFLAIATLNQLLVLDPNDTVIALRLADKYVATDEADKAESLLREHLTKCDATYRRICRIGLAVAIYANNKKTEAKTEFDALIAEEPNDPTPVLAMAKMFENDKLWDQIVTHAVDWYRNHPQDIQTPLALARILALNKGEAPKKAAENVLKLMFEDHPNDISIARMLAVLMQTQKRDDEAAKFYRRIIEIKPDDAVSINNLAWIICENQGKHAEALELAKKGLALAPNYIDLIDTRGVVYYRMGRLDEAIRDFSECIKLYPEDTAAVTAAHFHLARAFAKAKQPKDAVENLNKALRLNDKVGGLSPDDLTEVNHLLDKISNEGG